MEMTMENKFELLELLYEKKRLFAEVESITNEMATAPLEQLEELLDTRGRLLEQAKAVTDKADGLPLDEGVRSVLKGNCDMTKLEGDMALIYEAAMSVRAVVNRIVQNESTVTMRLESEKEALRSKIEAINASSNSVAETYERSLATGLSQPNNYTPPKGIKG
jgi:hypothetical protein